MSIGTSSLRTIGTKEPKKHIFNGKEETRLRPWRMTLGLWKLQHNRISQRMDQIIYLSIYMKCLDYFIFLLHFFHWTNWHLLWLLWFILQVVKALITGHYHEEWKAIMSNSVGYPTMSTLELFFCLIQCTSGRM